MWLPEALLRFWVTSVVQWLLGLCARLAASLALASRFTPTTRLFDVRRVRPASQCTSPRGVASAVDIVRCGRWRVRLRDPAVMLCIRNGQST